MKTIPTPQPKEIIWSETIHVKELNHFQDRTDWRKLTRNNPVEKEKLRKAMLNYPTGKGAPDSIYNGKVVLN